MVYRILCWNFSEKIDTECDDAPVLYVSGVDMKDGTAILDIKPYLPFTDCIPGASGGFTEDIERRPLKTVFMENIDILLDENETVTVRKLIEEDPRPGYIDDPERVYGMKYKSYDIRFTVSDGVAVIHEIKKD